MQCKCGGDTRISDSVNRKLLASLEFYECKSCGRVSNAKLYIDTVLVAEDPDSRHHYASLDADHADQLLKAALDAPAPSLPVAPPVADSPAPVTITTSLDEQNVEMFETGSLF